MKIRHFRSLALASTAVFALGAVPGIAHACEQELQAVVAEIDQQRMPAAERQDVRNLLAAARSLQRAGDDEACRDVVAHARSIAHEREGAAVDLSEDERRAQWEDRVAGAERLAGVIEVDRLRDMQVVDRHGDDIGSIGDLVVDLGEQRVRYALLTLGGGWFGMGDEQIYPVPLEAFRLAHRGDMDRDGDTVGTAEMREGEDAGDRTTAAQTPEYDRERPPADRAERLTPADHPLFVLPAGEIEGMNVVNAADDTIGSVADLFVSKVDGEAYAVVSVGGFLGFGTHDVALPLLDMQHYDDELFVPSSVTSDHLQDLPEVEITEAERIPSDMVIADALRLLPQETAEAAGRRAVGAEPIEGGAEAQAEQDRQDQQAQQQDQQQQAQQPQQQDQQQQARQPQQDQQQQAQQAPQPQQQAAATEERDVASEPGAAMQTRMDFDNAVLVLDVTAEELEEAPSFTSDSWPDLADRDWHERVVAFYQDLFGTDSDGTRASNTGARQ